MPGNSVLQKESGKLRFMALWQYSFFVLPKSAQQHQFHVENIDEGFSLFDDADYWQALQISCNEFSGIQGFLPRGRTWSEKLTVFGHLESTCLQVFCEDNVVLSVTLRIDFTSQYEPILRQLIVYFIRHEFILLDEELKFVPLNFETIKQRIESSGQVSTYKRLSGE